MRYTHTGHYACSANRAWSNTNLYTISPSFNQSLSSFSGSNITYNNINAREAFLSFSQFLNNECRVSVSRINNNGIRTRINQSLHTIQCIDSHPHTGGNTQTTFGVFTSHRFIFCFCNILISNKTDQLSVHSYNRKFLNLMFLKNLCSRFQVSRLVGSY